MIARHLLRSHGGSIVLLAFLALVGVVLFLQGTFSPLDSSSSSSSKMSALRGSHTTSTSTPDDDDDNDAVLVSLKTTVGRLDEKIKELHADISNGDEKIASLMSDIAAANKAAAGVSAANKAAALTLATPPISPASSSSSTTTGASTATTATSTVLLIFTHKRDNYLRRTVDSLKRAHIPPNMPVVFSQDGAHPPITALINQISIELPENPIFHFHHEQKAGENGYQLLSQHYGFGLKQVFEGGAFTASNCVGTCDKAPINPASHAIILEEDIEVAPDFFSYFMRMREVRSEIQFRSER